MNDNFDDYFTEEAPEQENEPHVETPQEREEREIAEATIERRHNTLRLVLVLIVLALACLLGWWVWQYYFHPYEQSQRKGWIMRVSNEGSIFKTYEAQMMVEDFADDSIVARENFDFTIASDSVATAAARWAGNGQRVIVSYDRYKGYLPWRGNTRLIARSIDVDSDRFLISRPQSLETPVEP